MQNISQYIDSTPEEFQAYIAKVEELIKQHCPEWRVHVHNMEIGLIYHLTRHDFTEGKDKTWNVHISEVPFAIERPDGNIQLADVLPIQIKE